MTHSMQQEADVALDQLHHPMNVHHRLLVPLAQIGTHLCVKVLQLTNQNGINNVMTTYITLLHHYYILIPLGFAGYYVGLGRIYRALI